MKLKLDYCSHDAAKLAVLRWHYSRSMPTPPTVRFGVWEDGRFIGAVIFSRGSSNHLGRAYGLSIVQVCELTRIALTKHVTPVSKILAVALRLLRRKEPGLRLVVSFADPEHAHHGGIYQAANWIYTGQSADSCKFIDHLGRVWHPRQVSARGYNRQYGELRRVPKPVDCERIVTEGKHRYLMPLDDAMRLQVEPLRRPYPKRAASETIDTSGRHPGERGETPTAALQ